MKTARASLFFLLCCVFISPGLLHAQSDVDALLARINSLRASVGLYSYTLNGALMSAAQSQAQWMADTGQVSHTRPDGSTPRSRALASGYPSTFVSENIYAGNMANVDSAWNFWVNSSIHYAGLTHGRMREIGIGVATTGWGTAYALVFGDPGGPAPALAAASGDGSGAAPAGPPSYVLGTDETGNIMHEIQPGDTLGDIALIYGYTWDDIPAMLELNGIADVRDLEVGQVFLVPPQGGTFTPTPGDAPSSTPEPTLPPEAVSATPLPPFTPIPTLTPTVPPTPTLIPPELLVVTVSAALPTPVPPTEASPLAVPTSMDTLRSTSQTNSTTAPANANGPSIWVVVALLVNVLVIVGAGIEYVRRLSR